MWYITTDLDSCIRNGGLGGLGHMFYLYFTAYIVGYLFNMEHVYSPFKAAGADKHRLERTSLAYGRQKIKPSDSWNDFFRFYLGEKRVEDLNCRIVDLPSKKPFYNYNFEELTTFFEQFNREDNILFKVKNSNRILPGQLYTWCKEEPSVKSDLYDKLLTEIRSKCKHSAKENPHSLVMHIRRGDILRGNFAKETLKFYKSVLDQTLKDNPQIKDITILSLGTEKQMAEITTNFSSYKVKYMLNCDDHLSFKTMMDAGFLIGGHSSFPKIAALYNPYGKKYFLPLSEGTQCKEIPLGDPLWTVLS